VHNKNENTTLVWNKQCFFIASSCVVDATHESKFMLYFIYSTSILALFYHLFVYAYYLCFVIHAVAWVKNTLRARSSDSSAIALMMEAVRTSETSVKIYLTTRQYIPEDSELHTRRRENLKSHTLWARSFLSVCRVSGNSVHELHQCKNYLRSSLNIVVQQWSGIVLAQGWPKTQVTSDHISET
jgi:hypothetical protein